MRHTLIPIADRKRLHREYYLRVAIVSAVSLSCAALIGVAAIFPAFIRAWFDHYSAQGAITAVRSAVAADASLNRAKGDLNSANVLLTALAADEQPSLSDLVRSIATTRGSVLVSDISLEYAAAKTVSASLSGTAPTRDDLLAFKTRLETAFPGSVIDVPIAQLAKGSDVHYSLKFDIKLP